MEIRAEGNNGGDTIYIKKIDKDDKGNDRVELEIGHCCVRTIEKCIIPVEFISAALTRIILDYDSIENFIRSIGWDNAFAEKLISKIK